MSGSSKQSFLLKRYTYCQQTHEKILNITNYQRNANQKYNGVSPHTSQNGNYKLSESLQIINTKDSVEKTVRGNVN